MAEKFKFSINVKPSSEHEFGSTGLVYDLTYFVWARQAYVAYTRHLGDVAPPNSRATPLRMEAVYTTPLLMTEEAKVYFRTTKIGRSSITQEAQINEAASERPVATITAVGVSVDTQTGRSVPISEENKQTVIDFEGKENVEIGGR